MNEIDRTPKANQRRSLLCSLAGSLRMSRFVAPGFTKGMTPITESEAQLTELLITIEREEITTP